jgi:hypothetical protein
MRRTGFPGLEQAIRKLGLEASDLQLDYASASIGYLNRDTTISHFYHTGRGTEPDLSVLKKQDPSIARKSWNIYFPASDTVRNSLGGAPNAGIICINRKWWESPDFPRSMFKDYQSVREGLLSHNKTLLARGVNASGEQISWAYVGSANMSPSAWGKLSKDPKRKVERLTCANWECGVLVPGKKKPAMKEWRKESLQKAFEGILDIPFKEQAKPYTDGTEPWFFQEN